MYLWNCFIVFTYFVDALLALHIHVQNINQLFDLWTKKVFEFSKTIFFAAPLQLYLTLKPPHLHELLAES